MPAFRSVVKKRLLRYFEDAIREGRVNVNIGGMQGNGFDSGADRFRDAIDVTLKRENAASPADDLAKPSTPRDR